MFGSRLERTIRSRFVPDYRFFPGGYALLPVDITLQLTFACNIRCAMCYQHVLRDAVYRRQEFWPESYPSLERYKKLLAEVSPARPNIRLTGGEPLLYPHLFELAWQVKELGLGLTIPTNGILVEEHAQRMVEIQVDSLIVSLNGPEEVHDRIVDSPGAFQKTVQGLRRVLAARSRAGGVLPRVTINVACAMDNQPHMLELVQLAEELGVDGITFTHLWYWDEEMTEQQNRRFPQFGRLHPTSTAALTGIDPEAMNRSIQAIQRWGSTVPVSYYPDLTPEEVVQYYHASTTPLGASGCMLPWLATYIRPNGDVAPCYLDHTVGNIKEQPFRRIWNGRAMRELRMALRRHKRFPACSRCTGLFLFSQTGKGKTAL